MVDSAFVAQLNAASLNDKMLYIDTVTVQELLDEANKFSGTKKAKMTKKAMVTFISTDKLSHDTVATASELNKLLEKSPANKVVSVIKNESLNKGLSVFGLLGWVAVGCGLLLFLMGGLIKKWMHGIN